VIAPTPTMWKGMASSTRLGRHSYRGACNASFLSGHCLIVAHPFWREPRAPVLLLVYPCSYFLGAGLLVVRHQMERGFATRLLQHGPVLAERAQQALRGPSPCCNKGRCLRIKASNMLAVQLVGLLQHTSVLAVKGASQALRGPIATPVRRRGVRP
jgi:hypothetical protein